MNAHRFEKDARRRDGLMNNCICRRLGVVVVIVVALVIIEKFTLLFARASLRQCTVCARDSVCLQFRLPALRGAVHRTGTDDFDSKALTVCVRSDLEH